MSKKALYLLGIAITIILGTFLYLKFCCNCTKPETIDPIEKPIVTTPNASLVPFVLNGSGIDYQTTENIKFLKNNAAALVPIGDSVNIGIEKLKAFLISNPKQKITITGYATNDETNTTKFENLGIARANDVKNYFVSKGLAGSQLDTKGEIIEKWQSNADTLFGPISYKFEAVDTTTVANDEWSLLKEKINATPLTLHFSTSKSRNILNADDKQKVADIAKYTQHEKEAVILIVGHSDNVGNRDSNVALAQKRADFSKNYLTKNGIKTQIETESKGPDEPIGDNSTREGKASNRRTVITIK
ncbi:OmpA family protein [Flavobacterium poyangense]|uniref:OmpA family protein n=1 Tax=Flavobacterium poyangense TaxID=2204302 RepID=UPI001420734C|nr:OmpA family protein [Flavobacterium sp. JXAS1]